MTKYVLAIFLMFSWGVMAQTTNQGTVSGTIIDEQGNPMPSVSVLIVETHQGTVTDDQGRFKLSGIKPGTYQVQCSAIGFILPPQQVTIIANQAIQVRFEGKENIKELQMVSVTAQKQSEDLQKVPGALASISAQKVKNLQISNINEIGRISPNFQSYDDGGGMFTLMASRGIFTIDDTPVVGVYVDGVPLFNTASFPASLTDIQRIEVLRGPQGTIYGRNTLAGAINIITQNPSNQTKGFISGGYGNLNQVTLEGGISLPIIKDKLFARISGRYDTRSGYIENVFLQNTDLLGRRLGSGNVKLMFYPNQNWDISLTTGIEYRENKAYAFVGGFNATGQQLDSIKQNHPYQVDQNIQGDYLTLSSNNALRISYTAPQFTLTSVSSYQLTDLKRSDEFDFSSFDINNLQQSNRVLHTLSEELRVRSNTPNSKLRWLVGVFGYYIKRTEEQNIRSGVDNALFATDPAIAAQYPYVSIDDTFVEQSGFSVFANLTYSLTNQLKL
ncbi:TonB-dependent receptor [uncultured Microscilla sp.]|uniref:TonB-dependent receptor n=1 Tax=uncultured Microscilla sp. TaxID=432653 RepID=UPI00260EE527|nr:TonB-dependent receptor [uncultured Microscilla sp.]